MPKSASATTLTGKLRMQPHLAYPTSHISARNKVKTTSHACSCLILMTTLIQSVRASRTTKLKLCYR